MTTATRICNDWPDHEIWSFIRAIRRAKDAIKTRNALLDPLPYSLGGGPRVGLGASVLYRDLLQPPAETARAKQITDNYKRARKILAAEPLWRGLGKDPNFETLFRKVEPKLDPNRAEHLLSFFEAVAVGVLVGRSPQRHADKPTREKAKRLAKDLRRLRDRNIRLSNYRENSEFWRLLDQLVLEMESTSRKPREDKRSGVRAALDLFLTMMFPVIGPGEVSGAMLSAYAAMLGDTAEREIEKQLARAKRDWARRIKAEQANALADALRKRPTPAGVGEIR